MIIRCYRVFDSIERSTAWAVINELEKQFDPEHVSTGLATQVPLPRQGCERLVRTITLTDQASYVTLHQFMVGRLTRLITLVADIRTDSFQQSVEACFTGNLFLFGWPTGVPEELGDVCTLAPFELVAPGRESNLAGSIMPPSGMQPHGYTARGTNYPAQM